MKLKRTSLVVGVDGKVAWFRSDDSKVSLRWYCPPNREEVGDEIALQVEGSHTYYFTNMKTAQKALDQLGACSVCREFRVVEFAGRCEECRNV